jgi:isopenicillin N synthase-like dioxygenase
MFAAETFMSNRIPVIDISGFTSGSGEERSAVARAVDVACRDLGFLVIKGHGVAEPLTAKMQGVSRAYFDLPTEQKLELKMPADRYRGYSAVAQEALASSTDLATPPDLKESFSIGRLDVPDDDYHRNSNPPNCFTANMWPERPKEFREVWEAYYRQMEHLAWALMRLFALALDLPEGYFDRKIDRHITIFSAVHYPDQPDAPRPGQLRAGAHTDYGSLTILKTEDAPGGLQVLGKDQRWIDVPSVPDTFVVNLGDLMAEWTNDRWVSTMHRVVNPPRDVAGNSRRLSLVFFHQPNYDAVVECLPTCRDASRPARYGRITSGEHLFTKINKQRQGALTQAGQAA